MNGFLKETEVKKRIELNEYQQKIVDFKEGNMLVVANAGSGKTATLLERTANLVRGGVPPEKILLLTFSKKAVEDLKERIDDNLKKVNIYTYHSLCYQTLMKSGLKVNLIKEWQVEAFFDKKVEQMGIDSYKAITSWIGYQKAYNRLSNSDNFVDTGTDLPVRVLALMYRDYEAYKKSKNLIDFDDMLVEFVKLIKKDNNVINVLHNMFHYIMVDEHQDTNEIQNEILFLLSAKGNLVCLGDVKQAIYNFRGCSYSIMERFDKDWKSSTTLSLPINYRSTQGIIDISNSFVTCSFGTGDMYQDSICHNKQKSVIEVKPYTDVVGTVKRLHDKGVAYKDIAVLYRTNMQGGEFEFDLKSEGIPCVALEGNSFTSRKSVKTMLGYLKLALDTEDSESFNDIYNTPNRYLSKDFRDRILHSHESDLLENVGVCKTPYERTNYLTLVRNIEKVQDYVHGDKSVVEILTLIDRLFGVSKMLNKDSDILDEKVKDIEVLKKIGSRCSTVKQFLFMIDNVDKMTKDNTPKDAVLLMTVHKSKGLEFKHTIVAGADVEVFPHQRSTDDEERRLFYVAITRAIEGLYVQGTGKYVNDITSIITSGEIDLNNITTLDDWTEGKQGK